MHSCETCGYQTTHKGALTRHLNKKSGPCAEQRHTKNIATPPEPEPPEPEPYGSAEFEYPIRVLPNDMDFVRMNHPLEQNVEHAVNMFKQMLNLDFFENKIINLCINGDCFKFAILEDYFQVRFRLEKKFRE